MAEGIVRKTNNYNKCLGPSVLIITVIKLAGIMLTTILITVFIITIIVGEQTLTI